MRTIMLYTRNSCPYCDDVKSYLDNHNISYDEISIENNPSARNRLKNLKILGVPALVYGEDIIIGYNLPKLEKLLNKLN